MNSKPVNYKEAVEYIESIPKFTQKLTQEHTREFLDFPSSYIYQRADSDRKRAD